MVEVVKEIDKDYSFKDGKARAVKRNKVNRLNRYDLAEQIKSLQRAFALERGENHKFREEVRALLRQA
jgi:hypothetical protein